MADSSIMLPAIKRTPLYGSVVCMDASGSISAACMPQITHLSVDGPGAGGPLLSFRSSRCHKLYSRPGLRPRGLPPLPSPVPQQGTRPGSAYRLLGSAVPGAVSAHAGPRAPGLSGRCIKAPKEGKQMPAVKMLHQQSASNSKPEYIMGHSFQAISLLVQGSCGHVAAVPLTSRIHEGLVFSNRDSRTLLDKLAILLFSIAGVLKRKVLLVA